MNDFACAYDFAYRLAQTHQLSITPPIPVGEKHPTGNKWKQYQTTPATLEQISDWREEYPLCNYGIVTGDIGGNGGLVDLEADSPEAIEYVRTHCPQTPMTMKSRRGIHFVYRYPVGVFIPTKMDINQDIPGLDIRGMGGLFVGPGSFYNKNGQTGYYEMLDKPWWEILTSEVPVFDPNWIGLDTTRPKKKSEHVEREPLTDLDDRQQQARERLKHKPGAQSGCGRGADKYCFALACELIHGFDLAPDEAIGVFSEWGTRQDQRDEYGMYNPWDEDDLYRKLECAADTDDLQEREPGYLLKPTEQDWIDALSADPYEPKKPEQKEKKTMNLNTQLVYSGSEFLDKADNEKIEWIADNTLEAGGFTILTGKPYCGKSVVVTHLIGCCLNGSPFFGHAVKECPVLYIDTDRNRLQRIAKRIRRIASDDVIRKNFHFANVDQLTGALTSDTIKLMVKQIYPTTAPDNLLVVIDTFRSAFLAGSEKGSEQDSASMVTILKPLKTLARQTGLTVLLLHHDPKYSGELAGSGAIPGVTDAIWGYAAIDDKKYHKLKIRTRDDDPIEPLNLIYDGQDGLRLYNPEVDDFANQVEREKKAEQEKNEKIKTVCAAFPTTEATAITVDDAANLPIFKDIDNSTVYRLIKDCQRPGYHPRLEAIGKGVKGNPYRYYTV